MVKPFEAGISGLHDVLKGMGIDEAYGPSIIIFTLGMHCSSTFSHMCACNTCFSALRFGTITDEVQRVCACRRMHFGRPRNSTCIQANANVAVHL